MKTVEDLGIAKQRLSTTENNTTHNPFKPMVIK